MTLDLPKDNRKRREFAPMIDLVSYAWRLRTFNRALGLHERSLDDWPVDFVEAVLTWGSKLDA
jgi:hypothetical protein